MGIEQLEVVVVSRDIKPSSEGVALRPKKYQLIIANNMSARSINTNSSQNSHPSEGQPHRRMERRSSDRIIAESDISDIPEFKDVQQKRLSNSWNHSEFSSSDDCILDDLNDCNLNEDSDVNISLADQLSNQRWHEIGNSSNPTISASSNFEIMVNQLTSLLTSRLRDLVIYWMGKQLVLGLDEGSSNSPPSRNNTSKGNKRSSRRNSQINNNVDITTYLQLDGNLGEYTLIDSVTESLHKYVTEVGKLYNHVGFHSFEHATHVTVSMNKLLSMVSSGSSGGNGSGINGKSGGRGKRNSSGGLGGILGTTNSGSGEEGGGIEFDNNSPSGNNNNRVGGGVRFEEPSHTSQNFSFGIGEDPRILFAMVFSALIHDLGHTGVPNSVLVEEEDELAILHNDVSVAEQNSLQVAFSMLQKDEFALLKKCICPTPEERKFFRKKVICMVMVTDISDQERIQIVKSRWNAAFPPADEEGGSGEVENGGASSTSRGRGGGAGRGRGGGAGRGESQPPPQRGLTKIHASQRGLMKKEIQSTELRETIRRRRFTMFTSDAAAEELAKERQARRLGIRTSMDFSGMLLDAYRTMDQLQQHAVLETMMNVADVAHTMQSFQVFVKWNKRLFKEFYVAHLSDRLAFDPSENWYENQIGFFSHYIIPLSQKMKTCGVFGTTGNLFEYFAMENKKRWTEEGEAISEEIIRDVTEEVAREQELDEAECGRGKDIQNDC